MDLFERDKAESFVLPVKQSFGQWTLVGVINYAEDAHAQKEVSLARLRLDPSKTYVAYDFWSQNLVAPIQGSLRVRLEPSSVRLLAVHGKPETPM